MITLAGFRTSPRDTFYSACAIAELVRHEPQDIYSNTSTTKVARVTITLSLTQCSLLQSPYTHKYCIVLIVSRAVKVNERLTQFTFNLTFYVIIAGFDIIVHHP